MHRARKRQSGLSLMENLFGIFVVAVCVSVIAATLPLANQHRLTADESNRAMAIAQKQMEAIKSLGYVNLTPQRLFDNGLIDTTVLQPNGMYRFHTADNAMFDAPAQVLAQGLGFVGITQIDIDIRRVVVTVAWQNSDRVRSVVLSSYVANL